MLLDWHLHIHEFTKGTMNSGNEKDVKSCLCAVGGLEYTFIFCASCILPFFHLWLCVVHFLDQIRPALQGPPIPPKYRCAVLKNIKYLAGHFVVRIKCAFNNLISWKFVNDNGLLSQDFNIRFISAKLTNKSFVEKGYPSRLSLKGSSLIWELRQCYRCSLQTHKQSLKHTDRKHSTIPYMLTAYLHCLRTISFFNSNTDVFSDALDFILIYC